MVMRPYDREALKAEFDSATPFRHILVDRLIDEDFARAVSSCYPTFDEAVASGFAFDFVNEQKKVQISAAEKFPEPVARLHRALAAPEFLADLEYITGISGLVADPSLAGGGMHITGVRGRLDVHVDFNYAKEEQLHRRLNVLVYLNEHWEDEWGGAVELWDKHVKHCHHAVMPRLGRCVLFETSEVSFHGVQPLTVPDGVTRKSFAAYYYTKESPPGWDGTSHTTVFKARPDEHLRRWVQMPVERLQRRAKKAIRALKNVIKGRR
jgi:Rps23 Pro-64 3,4-dihydroxylase Tpa1-like proline 4-hydroxylase